MLSFKNQAFIRFTDRLSFKKIKEQEEDDHLDFSDAESPFFNDDEIYEYAYMRRYTRKRPVIPFSEYKGSSNPGSPFNFNKRKIAVIDEPAVLYGYDGFIDHQTMSPKVQAPSPRSQFSFFHAIDEAIEQIKHKRSNSKLNNRKNNRFAGAGKINADVKIQFDGDKFVYRV